MNIKKIIVAFSLYTMPLLTEDLAMDDLSSANMHHNVIAKQNNPILAEQAEKQATYQENEPTKSPRIMTEQEKALQDQAIHDRSVKLYSNAKKRAEKYRAKAKNLSEDTQTSLAKLDNPQDLRKHLHKKGPMDLGTYSETLEKEIQQEEKHGRFSGNRSQHLIDDLNAIKKELPEKGKYLDWDMKYTRENPHLKSLEENTEPETDLESLEEHTITESSTSETPRPQPKPGPTTESIHSELESIESDTFQSLNHYMKSIQKSELGFRFVPEDVSNSKVSKLQNLLKEQEKITDQLKENNASEEEINESKQQEEEIKKQLADFYADLGKQAAEEQASFSEELKTLKRFDYAKKDIQEFHKNLENIGTTEEVRKDLDRINQDIDELQKKHTATSNRLKQKESKILKVKETHEAISRLQDELNDLSTQLANKTTIKTHLEKSLPEIEYAKTEIARLEEETKNTPVDLTDKVAELRVKDNKLESIKKYAYDQAKKHNPDFEEPKEQPEKTTKKRKIVKKRLLLKKL